MADHAAIVNDIGTQLALGDRAGAHKLAHRYITGADPELAQDLIDRAHAQLDKETEAHAERLATERRTRYLVETTRAPSAIHTARGPRRSGRTTRAAHVERKTQQYFDTRTRSPHENRREATQPYGSGGLDTEQQATINLRGRACLTCDLERTPADRTSKDGLCAECRDAGLTRDDAVNVHCARIAAHARATNTSPRDALRAVWRRANPHDRARIVVWVEANRSALNTTAPNNYPA